MTNAPIIPIQGRSGDFVVPPPRVTDAVGLALRGVFDGGAALPDDMAAVLSRIDRASSLR